MNHTANEMHHEDDDAPITTGQTFTFKTWSSANNLVELFSAFRKKTISPDYFYREAYPLIVSYCKYTKNHSKSAFFTTDIVEAVAQNVMIILFKGAAEKIDLEQNFLGYLYTIILREVYQYNREQSVVRVSNQRDSDGKKIHFASIVSTSESRHQNNDDNNSSLLDYNAHEFSDYDSLNTDEHLSITGLSGNEANIDKESALKKLAKLIDKNESCLYHQDNKSYKQMKDYPMMQNTNHQNESPNSALNKFKVKPIGVAGVKQKDMAVVVKPAGAGIKVNKKNLNRDKLSEAKKTLFDVQESLCLSVEDFAEVVGVSSYVMSSYLYRDEVNPKEWVVEAAKDLLVQKSDLFDKVQRLKAEYSKKTMSEILVMWGKKLDFDPSNTKVAAKVFSTTTTTILRWRNNVSKPTLMGLSTYYDIGLEYVLEEKRLKAEAAKAELANA